MAQKVQIVMTDDLDGGEASETVRFGIDGEHYEIDLNTEHAAQLRDALSPFRAAARRAADGRKSSGRKRQMTSSRRDPEIAKIRAWAQGNGYQLGDRGRIPNDIRDAYRAAISGTTS